MIAVQMQVKRLRPDAQLPTKGTAYSAGLDLYTPERVVLIPGVPTFIPCGIAIELPFAFEGQIRPRSSLSKKGVHCAFGTIDCDYRGEIAVILTQATRVQPGVFASAAEPEPYVLEAGDRIAQLVIAPVPRVDIEEVNELTPSARGTGGFGSTGK